MSWWLSSFMELPTSSLCRRRDPRAVVERALSHGVPSRERRDSVARVEAFSFLRRRTLLKLSVGALALLGASAGGLVALRGGAPDVAGLRILSAQEYRTL